MNRSVALAFLFGLLLLWIYYRTVPEGTDGNESIISLLRPFRRAAGE